MSNIRWEFNRKTIVCYISSPFLSSALLSSPTCYWTRQQLAMRLDVPQSRSGRCKEQEYLLPPSEIEPRFLARPSHGLVIILNVSCLSFGWFIPRDFQHQKNRISPSSTTISRCFLTVFYVTNVRTILSQLRRYLILPLWLKKKGLTWRGYSSPW